MTNRSLDSALNADLGKKILLLSGPRQVGKTVLARSLSASHEYLNYDQAPDRKRLLKYEWDHATSLLVLDELHKMKHWKRWLKGLYDTSDNHSIIVTGSARLDTHKRVGDSLAGRYFQFRLLPLDVKEAVSRFKMDPSEALDRLFRCSGFPEPFFSGKDSHYKRWRQTHLDIILRQDLIETESIKRIAEMSTLVELMTERVCQVLSFNSLREDLSTDDKSVKRWMLALENLYIFFRITPYFKRVKDAITKAPKFYFFDLPRALDEGARFENLVALALYKEILFLNDSAGAELSLHFLRDKRHREVDFVVCREKRPFLMVECKLSAAEVSGNFSVFEPQLEGPIEKVQVVKNLAKGFQTKDKVKVVPASTWLAGLDLG